MIRAIARQAEAERERRAKVIHAEGEYMAAERLAMAAEVFRNSRQLAVALPADTGRDRRREKYDRVFPLPLDILFELEECARPTQQSRPEPCVISSSGPLHLGHSR